MTPEGRVNQEIAVAAMHLHICVLPMPKDLWKLHVSPWSLADSAFHVGIIWRQNTGMAKYEQRAVRFGIPGAADWTGWLFGTGRRFEIEAKSANGRLTADQTIHRDLCLKTGVLWGCVTSYAECVALFESWNLRRPS